MPETRARDLANLAGAGATSSTVAYHETSRAFTLPAGAGTANQVISSNGNGTSTWKNTLSAPELTSATSEKGVNAYDSDGDDGAVIVVNGTDLGNDASALTVEISTDNFVTTVQTSTISILSNGTQIEATFNGTETNYNSINAGETVKVKVTKSALQSAQSATLSGTVTGDPTFNTTSTTVSTHTGTLPATSLGSYGGQVAGGGGDSNTKLLLNFDRIGGTDIEDSSNTGGDGYKVTATNAAIKSSPFGDGKSAMFFDGNDDYLQISDSDDFTITAGSGYTIECWYYNARTSGTNINSIFCHGTNASDRSFAYHTDGTGLYWYIATGSSAHINISTSNLDFQRWYHLAFVKDASNNYKIYVDGKESASGSYGSTVNISAPFYIGTNQGNTSQRLNGYLDEFRVVNGTAVYTGDFDVPTSRLSTTQSNQGTNIADITGTDTKLLIHSNQALDSSTYASPVALNSTTITTTNGRTNWSNSNFYIDGSTGNSHLTVRNPGSGWTTSSGMCIEFWVKAGSAGYANNDYIFAFHKDSNTFTYLYYENANLLKLWENVSGTYNLIHDFNPNSDDYNNSSDPTSADGWSHVAITCDSSGNWNLYTDGVLATRTGSHSSQVTNFAGYDFAFGYNSSNTTYGQPEIYFEDLRLTCGSTVYSGTDTSSANFTLPTGPLTTTWDSNNLGGYANLTNIASNTDSSKVKFLIHGDGAKFTDSATSGTTHDIARTGAYHSQDHGGIAPAMAWPASKKATGSAGILFNGSGHYLQADSFSVGTSSAFTYECWFNVPNNCTGHLYDWRNSETTNGNWIQLGSNAMSFRNISANAIHSIAYTPNQWNHIAYTRDDQGNYFFYLNGRKMVNSTGDTGAISSRTIWWGRRYSSATSDNLTAGAMIDGIKFSTAQEYSGTHELDWSNYLGSSGTTAWNQPTQIYGAYKSQDVGTIQLNATAGTGGGALDYDELDNGSGGLQSGQTALSTYGLSLSSSGAITGTLTGLADNSNSGGVIRIRARANADDNRVTTLGGSSFTGITQNDGKAPVLFSGRRYHGTGVNKDINEFGLAPDLVWIKDRGGTEWHDLYDSIRGAKNTIAPSETNGQFSRPNALNSFNKDGFTVKGDSAVNSASKTYIAWGWKAGGAPSAYGKKKIDGTESDISVASSSSGAGDCWNVHSVTDSAHGMKQSINTEGGFSITKYSLGSTSGNLWFKHGFSGDPDFVIHRRVDSTYNWDTWHSSLRSTGDWGTNMILWLNEDNSLSDMSSNNRQNVFRDDGSDGFPKGDGKIHIRIDSALGADADDEFICYAWKSVEGVSAFGTHTGQISSVSGTTVGANGYCGFKPRWLMIKCTSDAGSWFLVDAFRGEASAGQMYYFETQGNGNESNDTNLTATFTSNGFTTGTHNSVGGSGKTYISIAFA